MRVAEKRGLSAGNDALVILEHFGQQDIDEYGVT